MNKLEEQIEQEDNRLDIANHIGLESYPCFREGAQFVIDLELPFKFAEWANKNGWFFEIDIWNKSTEKTYPFPEQKTSKDLYQFWIENIYGR